MVLRRRGSSHSTRPISAANVQDHTGVVQASPSFCYAVLLALKVGLVLLLIVVFSLFVALPRFHEYLLREERQEVSVPGELVSLPDGRRLFFRCTLARSLSDEPVLLLMNGWAADYRLLEELEGELANAFKKVCIYDRAGIGFSDPAPPGRDALSGALEDLESLLEVTELRREDGEQIVLIALSYGGCVAMEFVCQHPEGIGAVLAVDPPFFFDGQSLGFDPALGRIMLRALAWFYESGLVRIPWLFGFMEPSVVPGAPDVKAAEKSTWRYLNSRQGGGMAAVRDEGIEISKEDWSKQERALRRLASDEPVPLRMIVHEEWLPGLDDQAHEAWRTKSLFQKEILGSHCTFMPGTNHGWALDHPKEFISWVRTNLEDLGL